MAPTLASVTLDWLDTEAIRADAAMPVTARARAEKRTMFFIIETPF
jgi:hypothetical protein